VARSDGGRGAPGWVFRRDYPPRSLRLLPLPGGDLTRKARSLEPPATSGFGEKVLIGVQNSGVMFPRIHGNMRFPSRVLGYLSSPDRAVNSLLFPSISSAIRLPS